MINNNDIEENSLNSIKISLNTKQKLSNNFQFIRKNKLRSIYLIITILFPFSILYIIHLSLKLKKLDNNQQNIKEKNELLDMCYKSRGLYYTKMRRMEKSELVTIQDKLNYLLIHESPDMKSKIADKILLHDYSIKKLGKDICVPIIKIYDNANDIKLEDLPDKFVLKCNHGSGMNIICDNKTEFDLNLAKKRLNQWKSINYGLKFNEFQYLNIDRKIFAEQFLQKDIEDYKIYCFHGNCKFIRVQKHLEGLPYRLNNYYDLNWKLTEIETGLSNCKRMPNIIYEKPKNFDLMIEYAEKLSEDFAFVRVDFYNINGKIYLGEMTFSPSNMVFKLKDRQQSIELGKLIYLDKINKNLLV